MSGVAARRRCATQVILCFRGVNVSGFCSRRRASIIYGCLSFHVVVVWVKMSACVRRVRVCSLVAAYFTACSVFSFGVPYLLWKQRAARILCVIPRRNEQVTSADGVCRNDPVLAKSGHIIPRVGLAATWPWHSPTLTQQCSGTRRSSSRTHVRKMTRGDPNAGRIQLFVSP